MIWLQRFKIFCKDLEFNILWFYDQDKHIIVIKIFYEIGAINFFHHSSAYSLLLYKNKTNNLLFLVLNSKSFINVIGLLALTFHSAELNNSQWHTCIIDRFSCKLERGNNEYSRIQSHGFDSTPKLAVFELNLNDYESPTFDIYHLFVLWFE